MGEADLLADLFAQGRVDEIGLRLAQIDPSDRDATSQSVYERFKDRGSVDSGIKFLIAYANATPSPNDTLYALAESLTAVNETMSAANLFMFYINAGGQKSFAYDAALSYAMGMGMYDLCLDIFEKASRAGVLEKLQSSSLLDISTICVGQGRHDEAVTLYELVLRQEPSDPATVGSLIYLARQCAVPRAVGLLERLLAKISQSYPAPVVAAESQPAPAPHSDRVGHVEAGYVQEWEAATLDAVKAALLRHGFCYLRNGCDRNRVADFLSGVLAYEARSGQFPFVANKITEPPIAQIYRFDAKKLVAEVFGGSGGLDLSRSIVRRVTPSARESFVPFHQDSTAFAAALINIWTPLTPAGGDYPTLQLVAQRVTQAEQTLIQEGAYNGIEIHADYVMERYKDRVFEVADAQPGDCVIFLGTTIHRSSNLAGSVKPRYALEARWSPGA